MTIGVSSIVAGLIGFSIPILGMLASGIGIALGIVGVRQGRAAGAKAGVACSAVGLAVCILGIIFWVSAFVFESTQ